MGTQGKESHLYTKERGLKRNQPAVTLILDWRFPELLYEPSSGWHSVSAAQADQSREVGRYVKLRSKAP